MAVIGFSVKVCVAIIARLRKCNTTIAKPYLLGINRPAYASLRLNQVAANAAGLIGVTTLIDSMIKVQYCRRY